MPPLDLVLAALFVAGLAFEHFQARRGGAGFFRYGLVVYSTFVHAPGEELGQTPVQRALARLDGVTTDEALRGDGWQVAAREGGKVALLEATPNPLCLRALLSIDRNEGTVQLTAFAPWSLPLGVAAAAIGEHWAVLGTGAAVAVGLVVRMYRRLDRLAYARIEPVLQ